MRWQTTVRGSTWEEINDAARIAIFGFFEDEPTRQKVWKAMQMDITPYEIIVGRDGRGAATYKRIEYEADVSVDF